jgi:hypothetical protein
MATDGWVYELAMYRGDGEPIGRYPVDVDWEPACQWARHLAICEGHRDGWNDSAHIVPIWKRRGRPVLAGFRVLLTSRGQKSVACDFATKNVFAAPARALSSALVDAGTLSPGEVFQYLALASKDPDGTPPASRLHLAVRDDEPSDAPRVREAALADAIAGAAHIGEPIQDEIPVIVGSRVLDEIVALTHAAGPVETGGGLLGHLLRDASVSTVFARITAQVPVHGEASATRLAFTSEAWHELQREADARAMRERLVGWWHSHPVADWNGDETGSSDSADDRSAMRDCFSEQDTALHRTVFPGAHCVALVANRLAANVVKFSVFGWHEAVLRRRGLLVSNGPA